MTQDNQAATTEVELDETEELLTDTELDDVAGGHIDFRKFKSPFED